MPKVSVIVPVYNVEKFLVECLDSITNQTLKEVFLEGSANLIYEGELYPETLNIA